MVLTLVCDTQYHGIAREAVSIADRAEVLSNLILELRRGTLTLSVLSQLKEPRYGYSLLQRLSSRGVKIDQNTLYPLLRRLEQQGLLESDWSLEGSRPRRYYVLSDLGVQALAEISGRWREMTAIVDELLRETGDEPHGAG